MNYPLIKKWLALEVGSRMTLGGNIKSDHVSADELEAKLAEGFEVYGHCKHDTDFFHSAQMPESFQKDFGDLNTHIALAIGKQPIKKKTKEEAALEFVEQISKDVLPYAIIKKAKEILEMK